MVRKYVVKCSSCGRAFSSIFSKQAAIVALKNHAKRKHGLEMDRYVIEEVEE